MLKFKKAFSMIIAATLTVTLFAGCGSKNTQATNKSKDQKVTVYCGLMEDHMVAAAKQFESETGIKVEAVRMSSGEIMGRIKAEKENPKASVWFGGPADGFVQAQKEGLLEKYVSPNAKDIPDQFKDKDGYWTGIYKG